MSLDTACALLIRQRTVSAKDTQCTVWRCPSINKMRKMIVTVKKVSAVLAHLALYGVKNWASSARRVIFAMIEFWHTLVTKAYWGQSCSHALITDLIRGPLHWVYAQGIIDHSWTHPLTAAPVQCAGYYFPVVIPMTCDILRLVLHPLVSHDTPLTQFDPDRIKI